MDFASDATAWREAVLAQTPLRDAEIWESIGSTNTRALSIATQAHQEVPALVWAWKQVAGRGRTGKTWLSGEGSLTLSLIVEIDCQNLPQQNWSLISLATGLAVCDAIRSYCPDGRVGVKWPNDIYADGKKIAGILVETPKLVIDDRALSSVLPSEPESRVTENFSESENAIGPQKRRVVIGIGVNVNNSFEQRENLPDQPAISLCELFPYEKIPMLEFTMGLIRRVLGEVSELRMDTSVTERWPEYCLLTGKKVEWFAPDGSTSSEKISGVCEGITSRGALKIRVKDHDFMELDSGTIRWS